MAYMTLSNVIFSSYIWAEKYSRNDFAFHVGYDMSQFVEKSEVKIIDIGGRYTLGGGAVNVLPP